MTAEAPLDVLRGGDGSTAVSLHQVVGGSGEAPRTGRYSVTTVRPASPALVPPSTNCVYPVYCFGDP
ncbi:hypothetical protein CUT44_02775 [Streptomyces carminius]|uniref:Uncharacterized protein n=1 Tax=Streptomyces carminius TaxID=2665496 RepID=A0A2M8MBM8_9ACTN|nr:hypothetical protein CUT44_02775 [Streptomyces carminius]